MEIFEQIGFATEAKDAFYRMVGDVAQRGVLMNNKQGAYVLYQDKSGAQLYVIINSDKQIIGVKPQFRGKSRRRAFLTKSFPHSAQPLEGSYYAWANPKEVNKPESGDYPFIFEVPDFIQNRTIDLPRLWEIQLTALVNGAFFLFDNPEEFKLSQQTSLALSFKSFIPTGVFQAANPKENQTHATALFSGTIEQVERKFNTYTESYFYWFLVDTLGGMIDVVASEDEVPAPPVQGGVLQTEAWLTGQLLHPMGPNPKGSFWKRLFRR